MGIEWVAMLGRLRTWLESTFPGLCLRKMYEIDGRNRAITLAGLAFIALVPLLIVVASWNVRSSNEGLDDGIVDHFGLTGSTAEAVHTLFSTPPSATSGITIIGFIIRRWESGSTNAKQPGHEAAATKACLDWVGPTTGW